MAQLITTEEFVLTLTGEDGKSIKFTVPEPTEGEESEIQPLVEAVLTAAKATLTDDSTTTVVQTTSSSNIVGIKDAYIRSETRRYFYKSNEDI